MLTGLLYGIVIFNMFICETYAGIANLHKRDLDEDCIKICKPPATYQSLGKRALSEFYQKSTQAGWWTCMSKSNFHKWFKKLIEDLEVDRDSKKVYTELQKLKKGEVCVCPPGLEGARCQSPCGLIQKSAVEETLHLSFGSNLQLQSFGPMCLGLCSSHCQDDQCHLHTGACECRPNWTGKRCMQYDESAEKGASAGPSGAADSGKCSDVCRYTKPASTSSKLDLSTHLQSYSGFYNSWKNIKKFFSASKAVLKGMGTCMKSSAARKWSEKLGKTMPLSTSAESSDAGTNVNPLYQHPVDKKVCICLPGSSGPSCEQDCKPRQVAGETVFYYGPMCLGICSVNCQHKTQCNPYTGECVPASCEDGWSGPRCQQNEKQEKTEEPARAQTKGSFAMTGEAGDDAGLLDDLYEKGSNPTKTETAQQIISSLENILFSQAPFTSVDNKNTLKVQVSDFSPNFRLGGPNTAADETEESTNFRRARQAQQSGLQVAFEATFPAQLAQAQPNIRSQMTQALKDNAGDIEVDALPGFKMEPDSVELSAVQLLSASNSSDPQFPLNTQLVSAVAGVGFVAFVLMFVLRKVQSSNKKKSKSKQELTDAKSRRKSKTVGTGSKSRSTAKTGEKSRSSVGHSVKPKSSDVHKTRSKKKNESHV